MYYKEDKNYWNVLIEMIKSIQYENIIISISDVLSTLYGGLGYLMKNRPVKALLNEFKVKIDLSYYNII